MSTTLTTADMLLAAIRAEPDDDALRLIYADWLDDHGDEAGRAHAAFIRYQMADPSHVVYVKAALTFTTFDIKRGYAVEPPAWASRVGVRRGFIESVQCELQAWLDHGTAFVREHPIVRVSLTDVFIVWSVAVDNWGLAHPIDVTWPLQPIGWHPTREAGEKALSDVLLEHARS